MKLRKANNVVHRDFGYFFSGLIVIYCVSGIALNHREDWNPNLIIKKETIPLDLSTAMMERLWKLSTEKESVESELPEEPIQDILDYLTEQIGEEKSTGYGFPTSGQLKIYYRQSSFHIFLDEKSGVYESVKRRPVFYHFNFLHVNTDKRWIWFSDIFAAGLILVNVTGLFVLKGKNGFLGRGLWFVGAGLLLPILFLVILLEW